MQIQMLLQMQKKSKLGGVQAGANNYITHCHRFCVGRVQIGTNLTASGGVIGVADASTTVKGVVQLNDTLTSTATDQAVTAAQAKVLKDLVDTKVGNTSNKSTGSYRGKAVRMCLVLLTTT